MRRIALRGQGSGMNSQAKVRGLVFSVCAILIATGLAVPLEALVKNYNLVLLYVLAVVVTGLRYGHWFAILAAILTFFSFNFFLTDPRYTLKVVHQDELTTLVFLFLIALACGPAASLIRRQFLLLRQANDHSEALRLLAQQLSLADSPAVVWLAVATEIGHALQADCCVVVGTADAMQCYPARAVTALPPELLSVHGGECTALPAPESSTTSRWDAASANTWAVLTSGVRNGAPVSVLVQVGQLPQALQARDRELLAALLQQGTDTCRRLQLLHDLESARVTAEVEQLRSALLASVSHDLKSPLAAMMGAAESLTLLDKQLRPQDRLELADTILQESRRLDSYIQNLLDMTRLGHGNLQIERDWVEVTDVVGAAIARLKRCIPGARTDFQVTGELPLLYINAVLVEQALYNILENACKYAPPASCIYLSAAATASGLSIAVEDAGPGIAGADRERIFDMFYTMADGDQRRRSHGMGLAICRGIISAHGGRVRAMAATAGPGSRFVIELPLAQPQAPGVDQNSEPEQ